VRPRVDAKAIFRLGGWRDPTTFHRHYIITKNPSTSSNILFNVNGAEDSSDNAQSAPNTNGNGSNDNVFNFIQYITPSL
jgi:hypothetical protein